MAEHVVADLGDQALPLGGGQRSALGLHELADLLHHVGPELLLAERRVEQPHAQPGEQRLVGALLHRGERVGDDPLLRRGGEHPGRGRRLGRRRREAGGASLCRLRRSLMLMLSSFDARSGRPRRTVLGLLVAAEPFDQLGQRPSDRRLGFVPPAGCALVVGQGHEAASWARARRSACR